MLNWKWNYEWYIIYIPAEEDGFFEGAPEAGFLVTQTLAGSTMLSGAVDSGPPIHVLLLWVSDFHFHMGIWIWGPIIIIICGDHGGQKEEERYCGHCCAQHHDCRSRRLWFPHLWAPVKCHCNHFTVKMRICLCFGSHLIEKKILSNIAICS